MKSSKQSLLLHPFFIASVLLLLLNDFYLKYAYHNLLTGKLSDVSRYCSICLISVLSFSGEKESRFYFHSFIFYLVEISSIRTCN